MRSIFSKLLVSHTIVILVSTLTMGLFLSYVVQQYIIDSKQQELREKGEHIIAFLETNHFTPDVLSEQSTRIMSDMAGANIWITDSSGHVITGRASISEHASRRFFADNSPTIAALFRGKTQAWLRTSHLQDIDPSITVALPLHHSPFPAALFLQAPITKIDQTLDNLRTFFMYALTLGVFAAFVIGLVTSRSLTRPIANISRAAAKFAQGDFTSHAIVKTNDEIGHLGQTFNSMADSLARVEQNRREFLANVSHELKTPIASIQALTETILDGIVQTPAQQQRYLTTIVIETGRIGRLIHDLLDLAQLDAGELSIQYEKVDLKALVELEEEKHAAALLKKRVALQPVLPKTLPLVWADSDRLTQVLTNLISNAIRYAPGNSVIDITASVKHHHVFLNVIDHGPGISHDDLPYIWNRFYRAEKSRTRSQGGTGLGLAITRKLMEAMGGTISVDSVCGQGATFTISLTAVMEEK